jgi:NAD(P)-dependent dehydrogenase (short-subunit alcohol dehydrogenase family)
LRVAYEVNVITPYLLVKAAAPAMRDRGAGWIVNIASVIADPRRPGSAVGSSRARRRTRRAKPRSTGSPSRSRRSSASAESR